MDKADVQAAFAKAGLARVIKDIDLVARASIRLAATPVDESTLAIGASKIGGTPDLPTDTTWPEWKGVPQSFIAQIRLDDVHQYDRDKALPENGMLWFFYDSQQETYGADPADLGGWYVLFKKDLTNLQRTPAPASLPTTSQFKACSLSFSSQITLPQQPQLDIPNFDWTEEEQHSYETLLSTFPSSEDRATPPHHRLLGNPDTIQDDMRQQCELVSHGITDIDDPRAAKLSRSAMEWRLLLQIDTDERIGMRWASSGMLYYWIKQTDLHAHNFDKTWLVLQSE